MEFWVEVEIDFLAQYGVLEPLNLSWRKFLLLVRGLNYESNFSRAVRENQPKFRREMLQRHIQGDDYKEREEVVTTVVSADEFLKGI